MVSQFASHSVFEAVGDSMCLATFPLPRVESLALREVEKIWIEQAAGVG